MTGKTARRSLGIRVFCRLAQGIQLKGIEHVKKDKIEKDDNNAVQFHDLAIISCRLAEESS
jgi:hypothetical protein